MNILCKFVRKAVTAGKPSLSKRLKGKHFRRILRIKYQEVLFPSKIEIFIQCLFICWNFLQQHMILDLVVLGIFIKQMQFESGSKILCFSLRCRRDHDCVTCFQFCSQVKALLHSVDSCTRPSYFILGYIF